MRNIAQALARLDPAIAADYKARAAAYIEELQALDAWMRTEMIVVPAAKRRVISSHDLLEYLAKAYGITPISVYGWTNKSEPSAAEVSRLARQIGQEHVRALFLDNITDPRIMERIASETGAAIGGTLYGDALSRPGGEADTYIACCAMTLSRSRPVCLKTDIADGSATACEGCRKSDAIALHKCRRAGQGSSAL